MFAHMLEYYLRSPASWCYYSVLAKLALDIPHVLLVTRETNLHPVELVSLALDLTAEIHLQWAAHSAATAARLGKFFQDIVVVRFNELIRFYSRAPYI